MSAPLVPGQTVLLDVDDSPYGTWRRGDRAEVLRADGRYWQVRIERNRVALVFDRRELVAIPGATADAGTASTAATLGALIFLGLWLLASGWLLHVHDQHCHASASSPAGHEMCEGLNR